MQKTQQVIYKVIIVFFFILMLLGGINHFTSPDFYNGLIPNFLNKNFVNYFSGVIELMIAMLILFKRTRYYGLYLFVLLMILFMPIHIWDLLKEQPAIGSKNIALVRVFIQIIFIISGYFVTKSLKRNNLI